MLDVLETLKKLPPRCYLIDPCYPKQANMVFRGERGYSPVRAFSCENDTKVWVAKRNNYLGVTEEQAEAMEIGSAFGWDVPGADPDFYTDE